MPQSFRINTELETLTIVMVLAPEALSMFREAMKQHNNQHTRKCDNVTLAKGGEGTGNSKANSIRRVQKECDEETIAAVMSGEMSPNAALVKFGIRDKTMPVDVAAYLLSTFTTSSTATSNTQKKNAEARFVPIYASRSAVRVVSKPVPNL